MKTKANLPRRRAFTLIELLVVIAISEMGTNRAVFSCPAALPESRWDTNINKTLGGRPGLNGVLDPWAIKETSLFSLGYNDWGLNDPGARPHLGLGGDKQRQPRAFATHA